MSITFTPANFAATEKQPKLPRPTIALQRPIAKVCSVRRLQSRSSIMRLLSLASLVVGILVVLPAEAYSRASAERPVTERYILEPDTFDRVLRTADITLQGQRSIDLRPYFKSQGVTFAEGCAAFLIPARRVLVVTNTTANREIIALIFKHVLGSKIESPDQGSSGEQLRPR